MNNATVNLTIDLVAFQRSLTGAFSMFNSTIQAMSQESPKTLEQLKKDLSDIATKAANPIVINADGSELFTEVEKVETSLDSLNSNVGKAEKATISLWEKHKQSLANFSLIYRGVMDVYNDITRVFGSFIIEATEAEKASARVTAGVRSTGGAAGYTVEELNKMAASFENLYKIDGDDLLSNVTTPLLTFKEVTGDVFKEAQLQILNMSRALGTDLQGAAMQVGKALQEPVEGLSALKRSGVSFSEAQTEVIKNLVETGQAAEAQKMILAELATEFGGQAEEYANKRSGQIDTLKISFDNLKEAIGFGLLPVIANMGKVVAPVFDLLGNMISQVAGHTTALDTEKNAIMGQRVEFERLILIYQELHKNQNRSKEQNEEYTRTINDLTSKYSNYLGKVNLEKGAWSEISTAIGNARTELQAYLNLKIQQAVMKDMEQQIVDLSLKIVQKESALYTLQAEFEAGTKSRTRMAPGVVNPLGGGAQGVNYEEVISGEGRQENKLKDSIAALTKEQKQLNAVLAQRLKIAEQIYAIPPTQEPKGRTQSAPTSPGGGSGNNDAELMSYKAMVEEMENLRQTETQKLEDEYSKRLTLISSYTAKDSDEQKAQITILNEWKASEAGKISDKLAQQEASALSAKKTMEQDKFRTDIEYYSNLEQLGVSSYDNLKATMEAYYAWAKENMTKEEQAMILLQLQQTNLRWGAVKKAERDAVEATQNEFTDKGLELSNNTYELQLRAINRYYDQRAESMRKAGISEIAIEKQRNAAILKLNIDSAAQMVGGVSSILGNLAGTADKESRKGFAVWKGLSLAQATIDAITGANAAFKATAGISPILGYIAAAAALAAGMANVKKISNTKYEKAATGGLLVGNSHSNGGILIEAEGDEYITAKDRVRALGKGLFDFLNFAPLGQVKSALMNIPMPSVPMPSNRGFAFAGGGSVGGGTGMDTLVARIDDLIHAVQNSRPVVNVSVNPLSNQPVKVAEVASTGNLMKSEF